MVCIGVQSLTALTSPRCMARGSAAQLFGSRPDCANSRASCGLAPAAFSRVGACAAGTPWVCSQSSASSSPGHTMLWPRQRLRMVGSNWCAASLASTNFTSPGGSSSVLSSALAVMLFMRSAGKTSTALPRPRALVRCENSTASRIASTRISLLALRFLSSMSLWAFSLSGQPSSSITVSGISTHRSAWVRTSIAWQLPQTPQAPCPPGALQSQARTISSASPYCPSPDGPASSQAWPRWASSEVSWRADHGGSTAWAGAGSGAETGTAFDIAIEYRAASAPSVMAGSLIQGPPLAATMMASQPRRTMALVICCHTLCRSLLASMRTKRCGAWAARCA